MEPVGWTSVDATCFEGKPYARQYFWRQHLLKESQLLPSSIFEGNSEVVTILSCCMKVLTGDFYVTQVLFSDFGFLWGDCVLFFFWGTDSCDILSVCKVGVNCSFAFFLEYCYIYFLRKNTLISPKVYKNYTNLPLVWSPTLYPN